MEALPWKQIIDFINNFADKSSMLHFCEALGRGVNNIVDG